MRMSMHRILWHCNRGKEEQKKTRSEMQSTEWNGIREMCLRLPVHEFRVVKKKPSQINSCCESNTRATEEGIVCRRREETSSRINGEDVECARWLTTKSAYTRVS